MNRQTKYLVVALVSFIIAAMLCYHVAYGCDTDTECQLRCYWACGELMEPESEELRQCKIYCEDIFGELNDSQLVDDYIDYLEAQDEFKMN